MNSMRVMSQRSLARLNLCVITILLIGVALLVMTASAYAEEGTTDTSVAQAEFEQTVAQVPSAKQATALARGDKLSWIITRTYADLNATSHLPEYPTGYTLNVVNANDNKSLELTEANLGANAVHITQDENNGKLEECITIKLDYYLAHMKWNPRWYKFASLTLSDGTKISASDAALQFRAANSEGFDPGVLEKPSGILLEQEQGVPLSRRVLSAGFATAKATCFVNLYGLSLTTKQCTTFAKSVTLSYTVADDTWTVQQSNALNTGSVTVAPVSETEKAALVGQRDLNGITVVEADNIYKITVDLSSRFTATEAFVGEWIPEDLICTNAGYAKADETSLDVSGCGLDFIVNNSFKQFKPIITASDTGLVDGGEAITAKASHIHKSGTALVARVNATIPAQAQGSLQWRTATITYTVYTGKGDQTKSITKTVTVPSGAKRNKGGSVDIPLIEAADTYAYVRDWKVTQLVVTGCPTGTQADEIDDFAQSATYTRSSKLGESTLADLFDFTTDPADFNTDSAAPQIDPNSFVVSRDKAGSDPLEGYDLSIEPNGTKGKFWMSFMARDTGSGIKRVLIDYTDCTDATGKLNTAEFETYNEDDPIEIKPVAASGNGTTWQRYAFGLPEDAEDGLDPGYIILYKIIIEDNLGNTLRILDSRFAAYRESGDTLMDLSGLDCSIFASAAPTQAPTISFATSTVLDGLIDPDDEMTGFATAQQAFTYGKPKNKTHSIYARVSFENREYEDAAGQFPQIEDIVLAYDIVNDAGSVVGERTFAWDARTISVIGTSDGAFPKSDKSEYIDSDDGSSGAERTVFSRSAIASENLPDDDNDIKDYVCYYISLFDPLGQWDQAGTWRLKSIDVRDIYGNSSSLLRENMPGFESFDFDLHVDAADDDPALYVEPDSVRVSNVELSPVGAAKSAQISFVINSKYSLATGSDIDTSIYFVPDVWEGSSYATPPKYDVWLGAAKRIDGRYCYNCTATVTVTRSDAQAANLGTWHAVWIDFMTDDDLLDNLDATTVDLYDPAWLPGSQIGYLSSVNSKADMSAFDFTLQSTDFTTASVSIKNSYPFTGQAVNLAPAVALTSKNAAGITMRETLRQDVDYTVSYYAGGTPSVDAIPIAAPDAVGTYTARFTGKGAFEGSQDMSFKITPMSLSNKARISAQASDVVHAQGTSFAGALDAQAFALSVSRLSTTSQDASVPLVMNKDYTVTVETASGDMVQLGTANVADGDYVAVVAGCGNYTGTIRVPFAVRQSALTLDGAQVTLEADEFMYTGTALMPRVESVQVATDGNNADGAGGGESPAGMKTLIPYDPETETGDYTVRYADNVLPGQGWVIIQGVGDYQGFVTQAFTITRIKLDAEDSEGNPLAEARAATFTYTGSDVAASPVVWYDGATLEQGRDYTVTGYKDASGASVSAPRNAGTYTVIIAGTGASGSGLYEGELECSLTVKPASLTAATVTLEHASQAFEEEKAFNPGTVTVTLPASSAGVVPGEADADVVLQSGIDWQFDCYRTAAGIQLEAAPTKPGSYRYCIEGTGNYQGISSAAFTIVTAVDDESDALVVTLTKSTVPFTGYAQKPGMVVTYDGKALRADIDYSVSYKLATDAESDDSASSEETTNAPEAGSTGDAPAALSDSVDKAGTYDVIVTTKGLYQGSKTISRAVTVTPVTMATDVTVDPALSQEIPYGVLTNQSASWEGLKPFVVARITSTDQELCLNESKGIPAYEVQAISDVLDDTGVPVVPSAGAGEDTSPEVADSAASTAEPLPRGTYTAIVTVAGLNDCTGAQQDVSVTFTVGAVQISAARSTSTVVSGPQITTLDGRTGAYNPVQAPDLLVKRDLVTLQQGRDYRIAGYMNGASMHVAADDGSAVLAPGAYRVVIEGLGAYSGRTYIPGFVVQQQLMRDQVTIEMGNTVIQDDVVDTYPYSLSEYVPSPDVLIHMPYDEDDDADEDDVVEGDNAEAADTADGTDAVDTADVADAAEDADAAGLYSEELLTPELHYALSLWAKPDTPATETGAATPDVGTDATATDTDTPATDADAVSDTQTDISFNAAEYTVPVATIYDADEWLYRVEDGADPLLPGDYMITVSGAQGSFYTGSFNLFFRVEPLDFAQSAYVFMDVVPDWSYNADIHELTCDAAENTEGIRVITATGDQLTEGDHFVVHYYTVDEAHTLEPVEPTEEGDALPVNAGSYAVKVEGIGVYDGFAKRYYLHTDTTDQGAVYDTLDWLPVTVKKADASGKTPDGYPLFTLGYADDNHPNNTAVFDAAPEGLQPKIALVNAYDEEAEAEDPSVIQGTDYDVRYRPVGAAADGSEDLAVIKDAGSYIPVVHFTNACKNYTGMVAGSESFVITKADPRITITPENAQVNLKIGKIEQEDITFKVEPATMDATVQLEEGADAFVSLKQIEGSSAEDSGATYHVSALAATPEEPGDNTDAARGQGVAVQFSVPATDNYNAVQAVVWVQVEPAHYKDQAEALDTRIQEILTTAQISTSGTGDDIYDDHAWITSDIKTTLEAVHDASHEASAYTKATAYQALLEQLNAALESANTHLSGAGKQGTLKVEDLKNTLRENAANLKEYVDALVVGAAAAAKDVAYVDAQEDKQEILDAIKKAQEFEPDTQSAGSYASDQYREQISTLAAAKEAFEATKVNVSSGAPAETIEQALQIAKDAETALENVTQSIDGADVKADDTWASAEDIATVRNAIAALQDAAKEGAASASIQDACDALSQAEEALTAARKAGTAATDESLVQLQDVIKQAQAKTDGVITSTDGADVEPGVQWVTPESAQALEKALASAQSILTPETGLAQQSDVLAGIESLSAAIKAYNPTTAQAPSDPDDPKPPAPDDSQPPTPSDGSQANEDLQLTVNATVAAGTGQSAGDYRIVGAASGAQAGQVLYVQPRSAKTVTNVNIPASITYAGKTYTVIGVADNAFKGCKKLTKVVLGSNVKEIGTKAFAGCKKLKKVSGGAAVTRIGNQAFKGCKTLKSFTLGKKVAKVGAKVFAGCKKLKTLVVKTPLLKKASSVKNCLKGSSVKTVKVKCAKKARKAVKATFKKAGKKVKVK